MSGTPEEKADAAVAADPAMAAPVPNRAPPPRRRAMPTVAPADADAAHAAQTDDEIRLAAADTTHMTESERNALEVDAAVDRRLVDESSAAERTTLAMEMQQREQAAQDEHAANLAAYNQREAARRSAHPADVLPPADEQVQVVVVKNFTLVRNDSTSDTFTTTGTNCGLPGTWNMSKEDAEHWYAMKHCDGPPVMESPPLAGTPAAVEAATRMSARRALIEASLDQEEQAAYDALRAKRHERIKAALGDAYEPSVV